MGWHRPMHVCSRTLLQEARGCPLSGLQFLRNRVLNEKSCHSWFKLIGDRFFSFEFLANIKTSAHTAPSHTHTQPDHTQPCHTPVQLHHARPCPTLSSVAHTQTHSPVTHTLGYSDTQPHHTTAHHHPGTLAFSTPGCTVLKKSPGNRAKHTGI